MNKFLILIAAFLCAYQFSNAQTEKGNQTLGFNFSLQYDKTSDFISDNVSIPGAFSNVKYTNVTLGPLYSYFIADKLDLGATFTLTSFNTATTFENDGTGVKSHNNSYQAMVYLRKYFLYANKIGIRTGPEISYIWANQGYNYLPDANNGNYGSTGHAYRIGGRLEAVYFPSKHLGVSAILAGLGFQHGSNRSVNPVNVDKSTSNSFDFDFINNGLNLSVFYEFGGK